MSTSRLRPITVAAASCALALGLSSCGSTDAADPDHSPTRQTVSWTTPAHADTAHALGVQAAHQFRAAEQAAEESARQAAAEDAGAQAQQQGRAPVPSPRTPQQCTTAPEDRAACTVPPGARFSPDGGDLDGDGVFEPHEPVGPGYRDPRAYNGGPTSGETQCAWLREQGIDC
ncbi:hypothetical protein JJV70_11905 [Streptomyces sp. JJ66]|uniref:hypothetical protein n=1 Tax=Streptomyces sp. JJ66 TaxID=2803843 RepID=UPI001C565525|nr:hypothetical protein [Streptomyces sp. JJ66]MBW1602800.1 hypothetical protein [Streptomyces sp. JJ66]